MMKKKRGRPALNKDQFRDIDKQNSSNVELGICSVKTCVHCDDCEVIRITHKLPKEMCSYFKRTK